MTENLSREDTEDPVRPARRGAGLALLAILVALGSLGVSGWLWWQDAGKAPGEAERFAAELDRQGQRLTTIEARSEALETQLSALLASEPAQRLKKLEQDLDSRQQSGESWKSVQDETASRLGSMQDGIDRIDARLAAAETRLGAVSARNLNGSAELDLAEIDYLLRLAQERLALFGDNRMADRALEIAGRHVAAIDNPAYIGLQHEIDSARQKLSALNTPDYQMLDRKLASMQGSLGALVFKGENLTAERPLQTQGSGWWARIRNAFSGLVTVRRSSEVERDFPALADQELIRQTAWLELEVARWAALRRDQESYAAALDRFSTTLERWFEPSASASHEVKETLRELLLLDIDLPAPDISAPWAMLQALRGSGMSMPAQRTSVPQAEIPPASAGGSEAVQETHTVDPESGDADQ